MMHAITRNEAKARGLIIEVTSSAIAYKGPRFNPDERLKNLKATLTIRAGGIVGIETIAAPNPLDIPDPYDQQ